MPGDVMRKAGLVIVVLAVACAVVMCAEESGEELPSDAGDGLEILQGVALEAAKSAFSLASNAVSLTSAMKSMVRHPFMTSVGLFAIVAAKKAALPSNEHAE